MRLVDAHHHLWDTGRHRLQWLEDQGSHLARRYLPADLRAAAADLPLDAAVCVQAGKDLEEGRWLLELAHCDPLIAAVVAHVDLTGGAHPADTDAAAAGVAARIDQLRGSPGGDALVGLRSTAHREESDYYDRPDVLAGLCEVASRGLSMDLLVRADQLPSAARAVQALPQLICILDHLGCPDPFRVDPEARQAWRRGIELLATKPNVAAKVSGIVAGVPQGAPAARVRECLTVAVDAFSPLRLMVGSDWPMCNSSSSYREVFEVTAQLLDGLSTSERQAVWAGCASVTYRLPATDFAAGWGSDL